MNYNSVTPTTKGRTVETWLPYPNYAESAHVLDTKRLSKQRANVNEIMDVLHEINQESKYYEHPVIEMWRGFEPQLCEYGLVCCEEWRKRSRKYDKLADRIRWHMDCATAGDYTLDKPPWFGNLEFHLAHQSNLVRSDPDYYWKFFVGVPDNLPMIWPVAS